MSSYKAFNFKFKFVRVQKFKLIFSFAEIDHRRHSSVGCVSENLLYIVQVNRPWHVIQRAHVSNGIFNNSR
jgi:hypothetical protein